MNKYEKRKRKREEKRKAKLQQYQDFENVASLESLYKAAWQSAKGVRWKLSVQKYLFNILVNINKSRQELLAGKDIRKGFICFNVCERGKKRNIRSVHFEERVIQKSFCANTLGPILTCNLITDNGASQKNKGTYYATKRLIKQLSSYYKKYGNEGYVLVIDFKSYFDNVQHKPLKDLFRKVFEDDRVIKLADDFLDAFGEKGLGLGSETSQIEAVSYANEIDHFIKDLMGVDVYGKYMDDSYIVNHDKAELKSILERLKKLFDKYGIILNKKKTGIRKLSQGFTFLKTRFYISKTGKIIKKPCRDSITRERKKLKAQARLYKKGLLDMKTIEQSFQSWKGSMQFRNARKSVYEMTKLYNTLFKVKENENDKQRKTTRT